jgi:hypothetical protein
MNGFYDSSHAILLRMPGRPNAKLRPCDGEVGGGQATLRCRAERRDWTRVS